MTTRSWNKILLPLFKTIVHCHMLKISAIDSNTWIEINYTRNYYHDINLEGHLEK